MTLALDADVLSGAVGVAGAARGADSGLAGLSGVALLGGDAGGLALTGTTLLPLIQFSAPVTRSQNFLSGRLKNRVYTRLFYPKDNLKTKKTQGPF